MMYNSADHSSDEKLMILLQQGRKDAFEKLFKKYYHSLWRYSVKYIRDSDTAEELVQEFFIHLWEKRESINLPDSVAVYFHVAIKNRCLNHLRKKFHHISPIEENTDHIYYAPDHLVTNELMDSIEAAINRLPGKCRIIFLLSRKSELSYKEIAAQLDISVKTVEAQMGIALKKLKEYLHKHVISLTILLQLFIKNIF